MRKTWALRARRFDIVNLNSLGADAGKLLRMEMVGHHSRRGLTLKLAGLLQVLLNRSRSYFDSLFSHRAPGSAATQLTRTKLYVLLTTSAAALTDRYT